MSGDGTRLETIAILGSGWPLWTIAATLAQNLPPRIKLTVVESGEAAGPAAATLPFDNPLHRTLGIAPGDLLAACNGTITLGTDCRGWLGDDSTVFAAPSGLLPHVEGTQIHQLMLRAAIDYDEPARLAYLLAPFRLAARAAEAGKLALPATDPDSPLATLGPLLHFDAAMCAALLRERCPADLAALRTGRPVAIDRGADGESLESVRLDSGKTISADFFIDCGGALAALAGDGDFGPIACLAPFDRIVSARSTEPMDGAVLGAMAGAMCAETPLRTGGIRALLFSSALVEKGQAAALVVGAAEDIRPFAAGYRTQPWTGNLLRLGSAAAVLGPVFAADALLLHEQASHLAALIPATREMTVEAAAFNERAARAAERIVDFLALPFALNRRDDAPWRIIRETERPETLGIKLDQFASRGRYAAFDNELFDEQTWIDMMIGFGIVPERVDPRALGIDMQRVQPVLAAIARSFAGAVDAMPRRDAFIDRLTDREAANRS